MRPHWVILGKLLLGRSGSLGSKICFFWSNLCYACHAFAWHSLSLQRIHPIFRTPKWTLCKLGAWGPLRLRAFSTDTVFVWLEILFYFWEFTLGFYWGPKCGWICPPMSTLPEQSLGMTDSEVTLHDPYETTGAVENDSRDWTEPKVGSDRYLTLQLAWKSHLRLPWTLNSKQNDYACCANDYSREIFSCRLLASKHWVHVSQMFSESIQTNNTTVSYSFQHLLGTVQHKHGPVGFNRFSNQGLSQFWYVKGVSMRVGNTHMGTDKVQSGCWSFWHPPL